MVKGMLNREKIKHYLGRFNSLNEESAVKSAGNPTAYEWMSENIPFFECPDTEIEETYFFRWWTYHKHIKETPDGFIITEFLPNVPWAGKHNSIVCPAGHHFYEGRWTYNRKYLEDYAFFWYQRGGNLRSYSSWLADGIWQFCTVTGNFSPAICLLDDFIKDCSAWEESNLHESGLFWSVDDRDGGEFSISGNGLRPTLNSYMYGYYTTIAKTAGIAGRDDIRETYCQKAINLKRLILERLWDEKAGFFKVVPLDTKDSHVPFWSFEDMPFKRNVRELHGFIPWYFHIPDLGHMIAWQQLMDTKGFFAPYGPTTSEQRHPEFMFQYEHECLWNGPSWPFATSQALTAMANVLNGQEQTVITKNDYYKILKTYTKSHKLTREDGTIIPWIDEVLDPYTGDWISRTKMKNWGWRPDKGGYERGRDYNHSTYCDLIISGLGGIRPNEDGTLAVKPLIPDDWDYFCLDGVKYRGNLITIIFDRYGKRYKLGNGWTCLVNGILRPGTVTSQAAEPL